MAEIRVQKERDLPIEVKRLFDLARSGEIRIVDFFDGLEERQITGFVEAIYAAQAFGIPLSQAKEEFIKREYPSVSDWASQFDEVIDEIEKDTRSD